MSAKLSPHFARREFACKCGCGFDTVDIETLAVLEDVRTHFNAPVTVSSGCRCPVHNQRVGGSAHSQHVLGRAADITVKGVPPAIVYGYVDGKYRGRYGFGQYKTFTHIDTRTATSRWSG